MLEPPKTVRAPGEAASRKTTSSRGTCWVMQWTLPPAEDAGGDAGGLAGPRPGEGGGEIVRRLSVAGRIEQQIDSRVAAG